MYGLLSEKSMDLTSMLESMVMVIPPAWVLTLPKITVSL